MEAFEQKLIATLRVKRLKSDIDDAADMIAADPELFRRAWAVYLNAQKPISDRTAWMLSVAAGRWPSIVDDPMREAMVQKLPRAVQDAEKRALLHILKSGDIPENLSGTLFDICFEWFMNPSVAIAIRVYCLEILAQIALPIPDLARELMLAVEEQLANGSANFVSYRSHEFMPKLKAAAEGRSLPTRKKRGKSAT